MAANVDLQSVQERMTVQQLLLKGHVQRARAKLAGMDPQVSCGGWKTGSLQWKVLAHAI